MTNNENTGAELAALAASDKTYKQEVLKNFRSADTWLKDFVKTWDEDIGTIKNNSENIKVSSETVVASISKIEAASLDILSVLKTDIAVAINQIKKHTQYISEQYGWTDDLKGAQDALVKNTEKQTNIVEMAAGKMEMPAKVVEKFATTTAEKTATAFKSAQKEAAKEQKSSTFQKNLTQQKIAKTPVSRWGVAKERAKKTKDKSMDLLGGLAKILGAILNPVALVVAFISKFLPYILIFGAMLYGAWKGMGKKLQEKIKALGIKILEYAGIALLAWKGVPILIHGLAIVYQLMRIAFLTTEHTAKMTTTNTEAVQNQTVHTSRMMAVFKSMILDVLVFVRKILGTVLDIAYRVLEFVRKIIATVLDMVLRGIEFALKCASVFLEVIMVMALIGVFIAGIGIILGMLTDGIEETVDKLSSVANGSLDDVLDTLKEFGSKTFEGISALFNSTMEKLALAEEEKAKNADSEDKVQKTDVQDGVKASAFADAIGQIVYPLLLIQENMVKLMGIQAASLAQLQLANTLALMNNLVYGGGFGLANTMVKVAANTFTANDSTETAINNSSSSETNTESNEEVVKKLDDINTNIRIIIENQIASKINGGLKRPTR